MKKIVSYIIILAVGVVIGLLCRPHSLPDTEIVQIDTLYETRYYSRLELVKNTYRLDIPKTGIRQYIYVPSDSTKIVYRDSVKYVMLPREYRYTKADGVEIWHSGIDSTIDSLNVEMKTVVISKMEKSTPKHNRVSLGLEAGYCCSPFIPAYFEYGRMVHKNIEVYGRVFYDLSKTSAGAGLGVRASLEW